MSKNKLTLQEKQMPEIKPPIRNLAMCLLCLSCIAITMIGFAVADVPPIVLLLAGVAALPSLIGVLAYCNHSIHFDKDSFVYRDVLRRLHRHTYGEIREIKEEQGKLYFLTAENKIFVNKNHTHSRWLLELAEKKRGTEKAEEFTFTEPKKRRQPPLSP